MSSQNAGQNCIGIERLLVHRDQYDEVYNLILERARVLRIGCALSADDVGTGVDMGAMISRERFQTLQDLVDDAAARGARVDLGGRPRVHPYLTHGAFFEPTVIGEVQRDMDIARHEREFFLPTPPELCVDAILCIVFAPIALVIPYDTIEEAIEIANETRYALGASVFGPDKYECLDVAKHLECGMVSINDFGSFYVSDISIELQKQLSLTLHTAKVCRTTMDKCVAFTHNFHHIAKISPSEEQRPAATEDLVCVASLSLCFLA